MERIQKYKDIMFKSKFPKSVKDLEFLQWAEPYHLKKKMGKGMRFHAKLAWEAEYQFEYIFPIHYAAARASKHGLNWMLNLVNQPNDHVNTKTQNGLTPLMFATLFDNIDAVKILVDRGAMVDATDYKGCTALHYACKKAKYGCVEKLLVLFADVTIKNVNGQTARDLAVKENNLEILKLLENKEEKEKRKKKVDGLERQTHKNTEDIEVIQEKLNNLSNMPQLSKRSLSWLDSRESINTEDSGILTSDPRMKRIPSMYCYNEAVCLQANYDILREGMRHTDDIVAGLYATGFVNSQFKNEIRELSSNIMKNERLLDQVIHGSKEMFDTFMHALNKYFHGQTHLIGILEAQINNLNSPIPYQNQPYIPLASQNRQAKQTYKSDINLARSPPRAAQENDETSCRTYPKWQSVPHLNVLSTIQQNLPSSVSNSDIESNGNQLKLKIRKIKPVVLTPLNQQQPVLRPPNQQQPLVRPSSQQHPVLRPLKQQQPQVVQRQFQRSTPNLDILHENNEQPNVHNANSACNIKELQELEEVLKNLSSFDKNNETNCETF